MSIFKKNIEKHTEKLPMTGKVKKGFRIYCTAIMGAALVLGTSVTAFAANDPITVINNLSTFIFGLIRAIGLILLGFGVVQVGLSLKSHDPSQRANGFLTLAGGVIITFAKEILDLIKLCPNYICIAHFFNGFSHCFFLIQTVFPQSIVLVVYVVRKLSCCHNLCSAPTNVSLNILDIFFGRIIFLQAKHPPTKPY